MNPASPATGEVTLRPAEPADADECAQIVFDAFGALHDHHRFQRDFPALEAAAGILNVFIPHPMIWGVVAEIDGRIVGSNFLDERSPIRGVGPITVAPEGQNSGVGRKLMQAVLERGEGAPGIRLLQDAFHREKRYTRGVPLVDGIDDAPARGAVAEPTGGDRDAELPGRMRGGRMAEQTLIDGGRSDTVLETRAAFQQAIEPTFSAIVERATGRRVTKFFSTQSLSSMSSVELFRLCPVSA